MGRTIIQPIGPLYGEAVNGTVYGRPNGSVYVPQTNRIALNLPTEYIANGTGEYATWVYPSKSNGTLILSSVEIIAESQDSAAYMAVQFSESPDFTTYDTNRLTAGVFNYKISGLMPVSSITLVDGSTYYARAVLFAATNVPVAYSDVKELTAVVPE